MTPYFIVTVARDPDVSKVCSHTQICGLRVTVESCTAPIGRRSASDVSASAVPSKTAATRPGVWRMGRLTSPVSARPPRSSFSAAVQGVITPPTTELAGNERRPRRSLRSGRQRGLWRSAEHPAELIKWCPTDLNHPPSS